MVSVVRLTMTGSAIPYTVPTGTSSVALHALDGDIVMSKTASGDGWTIKTGTKESIDGRAISGETLYFNGTAAKILEIRLLSGNLN